MEYGFFSLVPPLVAIIIAIYSRQVYLSLLLGIWLGYLVISGGDVLESLLATVDGIVRVFADAGNTRTILFCALVGGLIVLIQESGGVQGFINFLERKVEKSKSSRRSIRLAVVATGALLFIETSISILTVGTLFRPVFDKIKHSREQLAYLADATSSPVSILVPFNGWGAFIMGLLAAQGIAAPFEVMISSIAYNIYPLVALLLVVYTAWTGRTFGPLAKAEKRVAETGKVLQDGAAPMVTEALTNVQPLPTAQSKLINLVLPLAAMVLMMPVMLAYSGWSAAVTAHPNYSGFALIGKAMGQGSGSLSVLVAVLVGLFVAFITYRVQGIFRTNAFVESTLKGVSGLVPLAILMVLAFAISAVCRELGTGAYVADLSKAWLSPNVAPLLIFLISAFIAFSTGTSWGTFAIMMTIALPMAAEMDIAIPLAVAAVLSGGVFGDHCSPISDTTIISSMAAATDHIDHVRTQLPYALIGGGVAVLGFLVFGFLS